MAHDGNTERKTVKRRHFCRLRFLVAAFVTIAVTSCNGVPDYVVQPDEMAELLADLHVAECAVENNYQYYSSDSSRMALKQAILAKHGVTSEQYDTTMVWYGAHLDKYMDIYDHTEEILQERLEKSAAVAATAASLNVSGDSVDIWSQGSRYAIDQKSVTNILTFTVKSDRNSKSGDSYTWRMKISNNFGGSTVGIVAAYNDGTSETLTQSLGMDGWNSITFFTDSTRTLKDVRGYLEIHPRANTPVLLDSIQLVRNRLNRNMYVQRYRQRQYDLRGLQR